MNNDMLKFRVWDKKHNCYHISDKWFIDRDGELWFKGAIFESGNCEDFDIEQCTGLRDRNNKLIYEGDVLSDGEEISVVVWDEECYILEYPDESIGEFVALWCKRFAVIGTIHDDKFRDAAKMMEARK